MEKWIFRQAQVYSAAMVKKYAEQGMAWDAAVLCGWKDALKAVELDFGEAMKKIRLGKGTAPKPGP